MDTFHALQLVPARYSVDQVVTALVHPSSSARRTGVTAAVVFTSADKPSARHKFAFEK